MKKIDAHAHIFERIASFGKCGELRPIGNGVCRWANGDEMAIIPKGYGDKEFMAETLLKIMDEEDVEKSNSFAGKPLRISERICYGNSRKISGSILRLL